MPQFAGWQLDLKDSQSWSGATQFLLEGWEAKAQQLGHTLRPGPEIKNGRSGAKDGMPKRLRCGTIQNEFNLLMQLITIAAARRILNLSSASISRVSIS